MNPIHIQALAFLEESQHEQFVYRHDRETGLRALIAVHDTTLGPGLGGTRLWHYDRIEDAAIDALRLSEGMTYKAAVAGLALGGGKSVIMADGKESDPVLREERFAAFGQFIESLGGRYIAAEDVGTQPGDMVAIRGYTDHVVGMPIERGGSGDPSPMTAYGCFVGIRAAVKEVMGTSNLHGIRVNLQGLGKVGFSLAEQLIDAGAIVTGTDVSEDAKRRAQDIGVRIVDTDEIYTVPCDIFSPAALGATINDETIPLLNGCKIIAGPANNQLAQPHHGEVLNEMGIVYVADYVINAGGLINVSCEREGYDVGKARAKTAEIYDTIKRLLTLAREQGICTSKAAQQMAEAALRRPVTA